MLCLYVARTPQKHADNYHRAVAYHGLDIYAHGSYENGGGIQGNAKSRKGCECGKVRTKTLMYPTFFGKSRNKPNKHRRGTKLKGESIPQKIKNNGVTVIGKAVIKLFIDLKDNNHY